MKLHIEHELATGKTVLETFEGVDSFNNPPMTSSLHLSYIDEDRDDDTLKYGTLVRAETE